MIRAVTPGDLWVMRRKPRNQVLLFNETLLAQAHQPLWFATRSFFEGDGRDRTTLVFHDKGLRAYAQAKGRSGRPEQDIVYLSVLGANKRPMPTDHDIWFRLLERVVVEAGQNYIQRLYAAVWSAQVDLREIFRQLGFQPYVRRIVLQLSGPDWDQGTRLALMRFQARRDSWGIHKLYGKVAPHVVQRAEVRTPRSWTLPLTRQWYGLRKQGWVLGSDDNLHAYLYVLSGASSHVLSPLINPEAREHAADVMRFGLSQLPDQKPVYLLLPEYQGELLAPAQNLGFEPVGEQTLLVKSPVVPVRSSVLTSVFEPVPEPRITIPQISVPREDSQPYARTTRDDE